jgi:hypothetical protein
MTGWPLVFVLVLLALFGVYTVLMAIPALKLMVAETVHHKKIVANLERMNLTAMDQFFDSTSGKPLVLVREKLVQRVSRYSPISVVNDCIVRDLSGAYWHCIVRSTHGASEAALVPNLIGELRARRALFNKPEHYRAVFNQEPNVEDIRELGRTTKTENEYLPT